MKQLNASFNDKVWKKAKKNCMYTFIFYIIYLYVHIKLKCVAFLKSHHVTQKGKKSERKTRKERLRKGKT